MEQSDLVFQKLKAKEKEHYDLEDEYLKRKATFTNQYNELYERRDLSLIHISEPTRPY